MSNRRTWLLGFAILLQAAWLCSATDLAFLRNGSYIRHEHRAVIGKMTRLFTGADGTSYVDVPTDQIEHFEADPTPPAAPPAVPTAPSAATAPPVAASLPAPRITLPFAPHPAPAPAELNEAINQISSQHHLDPDLINSVIHAESGFNPHAVSRKGARGLMQLMPQTASELGVDNAFDPQANVEGGTRYLNELLEKYDFDLVKALAAYNAGPKRVDQYHGVPPYYETRAYVARIIRDFNRKKLAERKAAAGTAKKNVKKAKPTRRTTQQAAIPEPGRQSSP
jgi:Transglycosylase SLT domain